MKDEYPTGKSDLFAAFIVRCTELAGAGGAVAMITMQSWMFLSSFERLRAGLLDDQRISSMLHLGPHAFDSIGGEVVSVTAFSLTNLADDAPETVRELPGVFIRLVEPKSATEKRAVFLRVLDGPGQSPELQRVGRRGFLAVPGEPIAYWLSEKMRTTFASGRALSEVANLRQGLATADNNRFLRQWWEVSQHRTAFGCTSREEAAATGARWFPYNKGGDFRKWYGNQEHVVNWENDGADIRSFGTEVGGRPRSRPQNTAWYFSPSVSWSKVSSGEPAFRYYPKGFIFDVAGTSIFSESEIPLWIILGVSNSRMALRQLAAIAPTLNYEVGQVASLPMVDQYGLKIPEITSAAVENAKHDWDDFETSWNFLTNPLTHKAW